MTPGIIDYYNAGSILTRWRSRLSVVMRRRMLAIIPLTPGMRVLEVGATPEDDLEDTNFFSIESQKAGCEVWVTSPEDCSALAKKRGWGWLPFSEYLRTDKPSFDMVISSAVIEHVGALRNDKLEHLRCLSRVARRRVIVTTPNRYHWLEVHTKLPLIHWLPKTWHRALLRALGMTQWAAPAHLDLLGWQEFKSLIREVFPEANVTFRRFWFFGAPSNLLAKIDK